MDVSESSGVANYREQNRPLPGKLPRKTTVSNVRVAEGLMRKFYRCSDWECHFALYGYAMYKVLLPLLVNQIMGLRYGGSVYE